MTVGVWFLYFMNIHVLCDLFGQSIKLYRNKTKQTNRKKNDCRGCLTVNTDLTKSDAGIVGSRVLQCSIAFFCNTPFYFMTYAFIIVKCKVPEEYI